MVFRRTKGVIAVLLALLPVVFSGSCAGPAKGPSPALPTEKARTVGTISVKEDGDVARLTVQGDSNLLFKAYLMSAPTRFVVDLPGATRRTPDPPVLDMEGKLVERADVGPLVGTDEGGIRITLVLEQQVVYETSVSDQGLSFALRPAMHIQETALPEEKAPISQPLVSKTVEHPPLRKGAVGESDSLKVSFESYEDRVIVLVRSAGELSRISRFTLESPPRLVFDLFGVSTTGPSRTLIVDRPELRQVRLGSHPDKIRLVFEFNPGSMPETEVNKNSNELRLLFRLNKDVLPVSQEKPATPLKKPAQQLKSVSPAPAPTPEAVKPAPEPKFETPPLLTDRPAPVQPSPGPAEAESQPLKKRPESLPPAPEVGAVEVFSLNTLEADLKGVLGLISDMSKKNIVAGSNLRGVVSVSIDDVTWDQAFEEVIQAAGPPPTTWSEARRVAPKPFSSQKIGDLRLRGIAVGGSAGKALLEDPEHRAYIVSGKTRIAQSSWQVARILPDRIELIESSTGKTAFVKLGDPLSPTVR